MSVMSNIFISKYFNVTYIKLKIILVTYNIIYILVAQSLQKPKEVFIYLQD